MEHYLYLLGLASAECAKPGHLMTVPCLTMLMSKLLGYLIIVGALAVKVPQILKIYSSGSAQGISNLMFQLELFGYTINFVYGLLNRFPFSTYGENGIIAVQNVLIIYLVTKYSGNRMSLLAAYFSLLGAMVWAMFTGRVTHDQLVVLQGLTIPIFAASKLPQIIQTFMTRSSGKLSLVTFLLNFVGSVARVFTTIREVNDGVVLVGFIVGAVLNGILMVQIIVFGDQSASQTTAAKKKKQ